jgi:hypothetical protein
MKVERASGGSSLIDVLDRVLDKGIVIDAWVRLSLVGVDLVTVEARVVVASIATYLQFSETVGSSSALASGTGGAARLSAFPKVPTSSYWRPTEAVTPNGHGPLVDVPPAPARNA